MDSRFEEDARWKDSRFEADARERREERELKPHRVCCVVASAFSSYLEAVRPLVRLR